MKTMFSGATAFNKPISFSTSNVTVMDSMFASSIFNQDIKHFDTSQTTSMANMFNNSLFNYPISTQQVTNNGLSLNFSFTV